MKSLSRIGLMIGAVLTVANAPMPAPAVQPSNAADPPALLNVANEPHTGNEGLAENITQNLRHGVDLEAHERERTLGASCAPGSDTRTSDLCAQWKAADAADRAAGWAAAAFWLGIVGTAGLLLTLFFNAKAVRAAEKATAGADLALQDAKDTAARQLRAYVFAYDILWEFRTRLPKPGFDVVIQSLWQNMGDTPTRDLQIQFIGKSVAKRSRQRSLEIASETPTSQRYQLGPGQTIRSPHYVLSGEDVDAIFDGKKRLYVAGLASYRDIMTNVVHQTRICWRIQVIRHSNLPLTGNNIQSLSWEVVGSHNCADDECALPPPQLVPQVAIRANSN